MPVNTAEGAGIEFIGLGNCEVTHMSTILCVYSAGGSHTAIFGLSKI